MTIFTDISISPEWERQSAVWVGWPTLEEEWGSAFHLARGEIATFVRALSSFVPVHVATGSAEAETSAEIQCGAVAKIHRIPLGDIWLRDTGPMFSVSSRKSAIGFQFDGWGGKFVMPGDTQTGAAIASHLSLAYHQHAFTLEGGAVELDGTGRLITTKQCLLDGVRNPNWTKDVAEQELKAAFGVRQILWLECGLINDHTDGHVDNIARFIGPGRILCQTPSGPDDPNTEILESIKSTLLAKDLDVHTLPSPGRITIDGQIAPASHLNFLITNGAVFLPIFEDVFAARAQSKLFELFPNRQIITLPAKNILAGGGTFHCMTRDIPEFNTREM